MKFTDMKFTGMRLTDRKHTDLHIHSLYSDDGEFTPATLVRKCHDAGITTMAVADHNCVRGVAEALAAAEQCRITCIPAIEIDCSYQGTDLHVLGYEIDYTGKDFDELDKAIDDQSRQTSLERLDKIRGLGFELTRQDMENAERGMYWKGRWTGELFAEVLLQKHEYNEHPLLKPYRTGGKRSDNPYVNFYWDFCSQGKSCYVQTHFPALREIIDMIHRNHGAAVLAHPGVNLRNKEYLLDELCREGLDGIEVSSSYHSAEQTAHYYAEAAKRGMRMTCGSDFHGKTKPSVRLGQFLHFSEIMLQ